MKIGISDSVFPAKWPLERTLQSVSETGFQGIEWNVQEKYGFLSLDTLPHEANLLVEICESYHLDIPSLTTLLHNEYPLNSSNSEVRDYGIQIGLKMIELAHMMGVEVIQIVPGVVTPIISYEKGYRLAVESVKYLANVASSRGVILGIENVSNQFLSSPMEFSRFIYDINHSSVQGYLDIGNAKAVGYPTHWISLLNNRIVSVHAKDFMTKTNEFTTVLSGDVDWLAVVRSLKKIQFTGYIISTPPKTYKYCPERLFDKSYQDLKAVLRLE